MWIDLMCLEINSNKLFGTLILPENLLVELIDIVYYGKIITSDSHRRSRSSQNSVYA